MLGEAKAAYIVRMARGSVDFELVYLPCRLFCLAFVFDDFLTDIKIVVCLAYR